MNSKKKNKPISYEKLFWDIGVKEGYSDDMNPYGLMMKSIDTKNNRIIFRFAYDYKTNNIKVPSDKISDIIRKTDGLYEYVNKVEITSPVCFIQVSEEIISEIVAQVFALGFKELHEMDGVLFKNIVLRHKSTESSGYKKYGLYYEDENLSILIGIINSRDLKDQYLYCRKELAKNINNIPGCKEKCKDYSFEVLGWKKEVDDAECSQLHNCFVYKVYNDHSVLLTLKSGLDPHLHLLQFDNFNAMYDMFKFEDVNGQRIYSMYKKWNNYELWSVHSGNGGTTCVGPNTWNMINSIKKCVEAVCGIII